MTFKVVDHHVRADSEYRYAVETTQMSTDGWMDKKKYGVYIQWNIIQSLKEWNYDTCYNINQPWRHCAKWDKPDTKGQILYNSTYTEVPRIGKFTETKPRIEVTRGCRKRRMRSYCLISIQLQFGMMEKVLEKYCSEDCITMHLMLLNYTL